MKIRNILILAISSLIFLSGIVYAEIHSGNGYEIDYLDWFKSSYPGLDMMVLAPQNGEGSYHENITVVITPDPSTVDPDWEAIKKAQIEEIKKLISDFKLVSFKPATLGGLEARVIEYTGSYYQMKLRWIQYYTLKDGNWYTVSYVGEGDEQKAMLPDAIRIIESFTFK